MPAPGNSRPERIATCIDRIRQISNWLEQEGFCWTTAELEGVADELRRHLDVVEPRERMVRS